MIIKFTLDVHISSVLMIHLYTPNNSYFLNVYFDNIIEFCTVYHNFVVEKLIDYTIMSEEELFMRSTIDTFDVYDMYKIQSYMKEISYGIDIKTSKENALRITDTVYLDLNGQI